MTEVFPSAEQNIVLIPVWKHNLKKGGELTQWWSRESCYIVFCQFSAWGEKLK